MNLRITITLVTVMMALLSCVTDPSAEKSSGPIIMPINPNGDSDLALHMRELFDEGMKVKEKIKNGELPDLLLDFEKIHTAKATEPEKKDSPAYKVHALSYLQAVEALKNANKNDVEKSYTDMVNACMGCHREVCPGPMVKIKKMYL